jgi:hypothetical protein
VLARCLVLLRRASAATRRSAPAVTSRPGRSCVRGYSEGGPHCERGAHSWS